MNVRFQPPSLYIELGTVPHLSPQGSWNRPHASLLTVQSQSEFRVDFNGCLPPPQRESCRFPAAWKVRAITAAHFVPHLTNFTKTQEAHKTPRIFLLCLGCKNAEKKTSS